MKKKILISTGGSGGHVVPATILYQHLKDLNEVSMTCDNRGLKFLNQKDYDLTIFNINPFKANFFLLPLNTLRLTFFESHLFYTLGKKDIIHDKIWSNRSFCTFNGSVILYYYCHHWIFLPSQGS